ncbi:MAG: putative selenium-dependent hydroxylase accessory protein YqeC, partial [Rhodospirillales bacterium]|nr:putative selenium-dependent hydroxylase accessory protein YqeC [Rhodospirillales bacterium]
VLVTTTTKIASEEAENTWPAFAAPDAEAILREGRARLGAPGAVIAYAKASNDGFRLVGYAPEILDRLLDEHPFDRIVTEADGSARLPLKAPGEHEPVIPTRTEAVVMVAGLLGLGQALDRETVFRPELFGERTGLALGAPITPLALARILHHEKGLAQYAPPNAHLATFLNRADEPGCLALAQETAAALGRLEPRRAMSLAWGALKPSPRILGRMSI